MRPKTSAGRTATLAAVAAMGKLANRYTTGVATAERSWWPEVATPLRNIGEVDHVSVLPIVERLTADRSGLRGEPGVSYLIEAGATRVLFDCGLSGARERSVLAGNADELGVDLGAIDAV